jgi:hypothetical protein
MGKNRARQIFTELPSLSGINELHVPLLCVIRVSRHIPLFPSLEGTFADVPFFVDSIERSLALGRGSHAGAQIGGVLLSRMYLP